MTSDTSLFLPFLCSTFSVLVGSPHFLNRAEAAHCILMYLGVQRVLKYLELSRFMKLLLKAFSSFSICFCQISLARMGAYIPSQVSHWYEWKLILIQVLPYWDRVGLGSRKMKPVRRVWITQQIQSSASKEKCCWVDNQVSASPIFVFFFFPILDTKYDISYFCLCLLFNSVGHFFRISWPFKIFIL